MLIRAKGSIEEIIMIDEIQRLALAYQFEKEINDALEQIYDANVDYDDLKTVALRFRLLREEGYNVSSGELSPLNVLNKFKDKEGNFKKGLGSDVEGLLSLYEAAFYGTDGEDILDEAISFTKAHLSSLITHLDGPLGAQVGHALELPMRKRIARLDARFYISLFQQHKQPNDIFLELAKLDFNLAQSMWDLSAMDQLPEYMMPIYHAVLNTANEIEHELLPGEKFFRTDLFKHEMKVIIQAYLEEAQWCNDASFVGMGEEVTKEAFDWIKTHPKFLMDSSLISRLINDIRSNEFEQMGPHAASAIECYMKEHGVSWPVACEKIREMVASAWKDMNKTCLKPTLFPLSLLKRVVKLARMNEVIYLYGDGYTDSSREIKEMIGSMFANPIPL
ncbi:hypothetical protein MRB53_010674 [Persea americana]|uniref:Uncharacterized protein n=1 Tax=Persea americana TaxID=3435 RepID=A0ACC2LTF4_PERAE|nr:hypothetical protein MRB53_010674 [Persea americana]